MRYPICRLDDRQGSSESPTYPGRFTALVDQPGSGSTSFTRVLPIKPFNEALKTAIRPPVGSNGFNGGDLLELAIWGVVGAVVAFRYFSWEPHP